MPKSKNIDESKWEKAKELAKKQNQGSNYAYITGIYKRMGGKFLKDKFFDNIYSQISDYFQKNYNQKVKKVIIHIKL